MAYLTIPYKSYNYVSWEIQNFDNPFNSTYYVKAGICFDPSCVYNYGAPLPGEPSNIISEVYANPSDVDNFVVGNTDPTIHPLNPNTTYTFYAFALSVNGNYYYAGGPLDATTTSAPPNPLPTTPGAAYAYEGDRGDGDLYIRWSASSYADYYEVQYWDWHLITTIATPLYSNYYYMSGLSYGTAYHFQVRAVNSTGYSGWSEEKIITTTPQPPGLTLSSQTNTSITLYVYGASGNYDYLEVRCITTGATQTVANNSSVTFSGLTQGTSYTFQIHSYLYVADSGYTGYLESYGGGVVTASTTSSPVRPALFSWDTPKVSGQPFNVSASEWSRLIAYVEALDTYKGIGMPGGWVWYYPSPGDDFSAVNHYDKIQWTVTRFQGRGDLTGIWATYSFPVYFTGDDVSAQELNNLVSALNSIP